MNDWLEFILHTVVGAIVTYWTTKHAIKGVKRGHKKVRKRLQKFFQ